MAVVIGSTGSLLHLCCLEEFMHSLFYAPADMDKLYLHISCPDILNPLQSKDSGSLKDISVGITFC